MNILLIGAFLVSLLSATARASLNVIDRSMFRSGSRNVLATGLSNNILPVILLLPVFIFFDFDLLIKYLMSPSMWILAFSAQATAYLFTYAFKKLTILDVAVWTKSTDLLIPFAFIIFGLSVSYIDILFSMTTIVIVFSYIFLTRSFDFRLSRHSLAVISAVTGQAILSAVIIAKLSNTITEACWLAFSILIGRALISFVLAAPALVRSREFVIFDGPVIFFRAIITIVVQLTYILALSLDYPSLSWCVFNTTGLIAVLFSGLINERPSLQSVILLSTLVVASICRILAG